ncbi:MAG: NAD(P)H-dependent oxidoreductase [Porphyromonas sp.]|nr:NAD(P)H-dependent oxidoreductase [Porphyromonas sp.]
MKTLVVVGHPHLQKSVVNKAWYEYIQGKSNELNTTVRLLSDHYGDNGFDIEKEQSVLSEYDRIILQFPLYWYMVPAIMKEWMDRVWCEGWAYGENGDKMEGKLIEVAVSTGAPDFVFDAGISLETYLSFIKGSAGFLRAKSGRLFALYGAEINMTPERLHKSCEEYAEFIRSEQ